jgi:hypothetical protein
MHHNIEYVALHAWRNYEGGQEYCDPDENPDGWCVYLSIEDNGGSLMDIADEKDFETFEEAYTYALNLATDHGVFVREY